MVRHTTIDNVMFGGPAYHSKQFRKGDVIISIDGTPATSDNIITLLVGSDEPGSTVTITCGHSEGQSVPDDLVAHKLVKSARQGFDWRPHFSQSSPEFFLNAQDMPLSPRASHSPSFRAARHHPKMITWDTTLTRASTADLVDVKAMFELFTSIKDITCKRKDPELGAAADEIIELWTNVTEAAHAREEAIARNVRAIQEDTKQALSRLGATLARLHPRPAAAAAPALQQEHHPHAAHHSSRELSRERDGSPHACLGAGSLESGAATLDSDVSPPQQVCIRVRVCVRLSCLQAVTQISR